MTLMYKSFQTSNSLITIDFKLYEFYDLFLKFKYKARIQASKNTSNYFFFFPKTIIFI